jgi:predicted DNA binding CopG/RHH family protein
MAKEKKTKKSKKMSYGGKDLVAKDAFAPEHVKIRISLMVQGDILSKFKAKATEDGIGYQVLMQIALAEYLKGKRVDDRLQAIESELFKKRHA